MNADSAMIKCPNIIGGTYVQRKDICFEISFVTIASNANTYVSTSLTEKQPIKRTCHVFIPSIDGADGFDIHIAIYV